MEGATDAFSLGVFDFGVEVRGFDADFDEVPLDLAGRLAFAERFTATAAFLVDLGATFFLTAFLAAAVFLEDAAFGFFLAVLFFAALFLLAAAPFGLALFLAIDLLDRALFPAVLFFFALIFAIPRPPLRSSPWYVGGKAASI